jgi:hypothetical protein
VDRHARDYLNGIADGIPRMPRKLTQREVFADQVFRYLQLSSRVLFLLGALLGYHYFMLTGAAVGCAIGLGCGALMRRSMGIRGSGAEGFMTRRRERAGGARRGLLEIALEALRDNRFTQQKCQAICDAYEDFTRRASVCRTDEELSQAIATLDSQVKGISYGDSH